MTQSKTFGRYNLIRKVAQGGMAEIFLAKFQGIGGFEKKIIIKRILPRFSENEEFIKMLIHEAKTAVQLHHQNIVQIYDLGKVRDTYYISMEYIRGKDLRTVLNKFKSQNNVLQRELSVFIAREVAKGLDYAHNITDQNDQPLNLVHRDISPPNILLSLEGEVKIIDFGIAKATSQATDTQAGVFKGKFAYMAPEQAYGLPVDRRADIFATGLILWEMLTGKKLLDGESDIATLERAKKIDSFDIPFAEYQIPEQLENIIRRSLKQDRSARYQSAGEMARDLTIYLNLNYPGFSELDLAESLRSTFNLDKRRQQGDSSVTTPGQGERSLTGSDFFRAFANGGRELTDSSLTGNHSLERSISDLSGKSLSAKKKIEQRQQPEDYWSLDNDLRDDIEVFTMTDDDESGDENALEEKKKKQPGWVSQLAEESEESGNNQLHPLLSKALSTETATDTSDDNSKHIHSTHSHSNQHQQGSQHPSPHNNQHPHQIKNEISSSNNHVNAKNNIQQAKTSLREQEDLLAAKTHFSTTNNQSIKEDHTLPFHHTSHENPYLENQKEQNQKAQLETKSSKFGNWAVVIVSLLLLGAVASVVIFQKPPIIDSANKAAVTIEFTPKDAEVLVDGILQSGIRSPVVLNLPIGKQYSIKFQKEGFKEETLPIDLSMSSGDPQQFAIELKENANISNSSHTTPLAKGNAKLILNGISSDAEITINGNKITTSDLSSLPKEERLTVKVSAKDYLPFEKTVILSDKPTSIDVSLQAEPVHLIINTNPDGAVVSINGKRTGVTPYDGDGYIPNKTYTIEISAPGYRSYSTQLTPTVGTNLDVRVNLAGDTAPPDSVKTTISSAKTNKTIKDAPKNTNQPASNNGNVTNNAINNSANTTPNTAPTPAVTNETLPQKASGMIQISISVTPWAEVYVDGKYVGKTPVKNVSVKPGRHKLRLVNTELQIDYEVEKEIVPPQFGEVQSFSFELG